jgi:DNA-binding transcriptional MocR family regulator
MWDLRVIDTDKSLYIAVADAIERDIRAGILKAGEKLPPQRDLAKKVGVNVTTITRAYKDAEKRGLVSSIVGSGTYVSSDLGFHAALVNTDKGSDQRIEMGLVLPLYAAEPDITPVIRRVLHKINVNELMGYTPAQGMLRHRQAGSLWMKRFGIEADTENIIVTAGAQHALNCILSSVFQPGDRIAVDYLTYPGIKTAAKICGIHLEAVTMDAEGMTPQGLEAVCSRHDIKGVYTVSTMQNPTNAVMSERRCEAVTQIIKDRGLILIEDDLYRFVSSEDAGALTRRLPEQSIYIAGTSKAFFAGLRVSFVAAPVRFCNRIAQAVVDTLWMAPALNAEIACECITSGLTEEIIAAKRQELRRRVRRLEEVLSVYEYRYVQDSMFVWLKLPDERRSGEFEKTAADNGLNLVAADRFSVGSWAPPNFVRISLSGAETMEEFERGLEILSKMLRYEIGVVGGVI